MKWQKQSDHLAISDKGYRVAKFVVEWETVYRASIRGEFIGSAQESFDAAKQVCENNLEIMGSDQ